VSISVLVCPPAPFTSIALATEMLYGEKKAFSVGFASCR
jgi:hypothetical protein